MIRSYIKYIVCIGIMITITACGDSSTGPDPSEAPELPEVNNEQAKMDVSFFENTNPKTLAKGTSNYEDGKNTALSASGSFQSNLGYQGFLDQSNQTDPSFNDGVWEWKFNYQYQGRSAEIRTTAEEKVDKVEWAQYWSFDDGQGNSYEDYKIFEGVASKDGSTGSWTFNTLDPDGGSEIPVITTSYDITSDTQKNLTSEFFNKGTTTASYEYVEDGADHTLTYDVGTDIIVVYWNADTGEGYYEKNGNRRSWDSNQQDI